MTAHAMQGDREVCLSAGMDDYITKPVTSKSLEEIVTKWLPKRDANDMPGGNGGPNDAAHATLQPPSAEVEVFDEAGFLVRMVNDTELAQKIAQIFLDDLPQRIEQLGVAIKDADIETVACEAHSIKGAAATICGEALRAAAAHLEQAARDGDLGEAPQYFALLEDRYQLLKVAVQRFLDAAH